MKDTIKLVRELKYEMIRTLQKLEDNEKIKEKK